VRLHSAAGLLLLLLLESLVRSIKQKSAGSHPIQPPLSKESPPSLFGCSLRLAFWPSTRRRSFEFSAALCWPLIFFFFFPVCR
jgi:hypothetical protein